MHPLEGHLNNSCGDIVGFLGLQFDRKLNQLANRPERIVKLRNAIKIICSRSVVSGEQLRKLVGHCTWLALLRRESLSIFNECYAFIERFSASAAPLWPSAANELRHFGSVMPLLVVDFGAGWSDTVYASDSSHLGYGVCYRELSGGVARDLG